ncbi:BTAD domain-containing putative transcriptional regulator [Bogoriella caseilytica]|uniref:Putative ATPase n=1 Tax=Bogoriella caseilytica TaxID=56055 RepID=A0A3N2BCA0_9MICO|nr:BTAD domain-containing putative transcriptional regulator [Bogoriella caseilytica]ROR72832.1 putative ATPase [Bogoriella caseilytica]
MPPLSASVEIRVLGPLEIDVDGQPRPISGRVRRAILGVLALHPGEVLEISRLVDMIWQDHPPATAVNTLRVHLSQLRRSLGADGLVESVGAGYRLNVARDAVDAFRFESLIRTGRAALSGGNPEAARDALASAMDLWRGEPLVGIACPAAEEEVEWLRVLHGEALVDLAEAELRVAGANPDLPTLQRLAVERPFDERVWSLVMLAHYWAGNQADALEAYQQAAHSLREELGLDPGPRMRELHSQILSQDPALAPRSPARLDLPNFSTPFLGRTAEIEMVSSLLAEHHLVTLTGLGGVGKTRLAAAAAAECARRFSGGTVFVPLAGIADELLVIDAIATRVQATEATVEAVCQAMEDRPRLLVLDNCEDLLDAVAGVVADIRSRCADVTVLATSRVPLGLTGECAWAVPPLGVSAAEAREVDDEGVAASEAAALFRDRAQQANPALRLTSTDHRAIAEVVARLGGFPLGIELAAAQCGVLTLSEIAARLRSGPESMPSQVRDRPGRHESMETALEGTLQLLSEPARILLARLTIFRGPVDVNAVEAVCAGTPVEQGTGVALLSELVRAATVNVDLTGTRARYWLLPPVRQSALAAVNRLVEQPVEITELLPRHARHFASLAEEIRPAAGRAAEAEVIERLDAAAADIRAALEYAAESDPQLGLEFAAAMSPYWMQRRAHAEGRRWAATMLARADEAPAAVRAQALHTAGSLAFDDGDRAEATTLLSSALDLWTELDDADGSGRALNNLAGIASDSGDHQTAIARWQQAHELFVGIGHEVGVASTELNLGIASEKLGDLQRAVSLLERALDGFRATGHRPTEALVLERLSFLALRRGQHQHAMGYARAARLVREESDSPERRARSRWQVADCHRVLGQDEDARVELAGAARSVLEDDLADAWWVPALLETAAALDAASEPSRAAQLLGLAGAHRRRAGDAADQATAWQLAAVRAELTEALGEHGVLTEGLVGEALLLESVLAELASHSRALQQEHPDRG